MSPTGLAPMPCAVCGTPSRLSLLSEEAPLKGFCSWSCIMVHAAGQEQATRLVLIAEAEAGLLRMKTLHEDLRGRLAEPLIAAIHEALLRLSAAVDRLRALA